MERSYSIKDVCTYVANIHNTVFTSFEEAEKAYIKHIQRVEQKKCIDPLHEFYRMYHKNYRRFFTRKEIKSSWYDFNEIKKILKENYYWGTQVFNCHSYERTDCIYNSDGVSICVNHDYGYIDVVGLNDCDFYVVEEAYRKKYNEYFK